MLGMLYIVHISNSLNNNLSDCQYKLFAKIKVLCVHLLHACVCAGSHMQLLHSCACLCSFFPCVDSCNFNASSTYIA